MLLCFTCLNVARIPSISASSNIGTTIRSIFLVRSISGGLLLPRHMLYYPNLPESGKPQLCSFANFLLSSSSHVQNHHAVDVLLSGSDLVPKAGGFSFSSVASCSFLSFIFPLKSQSASRFTQSCSFPAPFNFIVIFYDRCRNFRWRQLFSWFFHRFFHRLFLLESFRQRSSPSSSGGPESAYPDIPG